MSTVVSKHYVLYLLSIILSFLRCFIVFQYRLILSRYKCIMNMLRYVNSFRYAFNHNKVEWGALNNMGMVFTRGACVFWRFKLSVFSTSYVVVPWPNNFSYMLFSKKQDCTQHADVKKEKSYPICYFLFNFLTPCY